jgi:hypothetical protein
MKLLAGNRNWKGALFATGVLVAGCIPDPEPELEDAETPALDGATDERDAAYEPYEEAGLDAAQDASGAIDAGASLDGGYQDAAPVVDASATADASEAAVVLPDAGEVSDASAEAMTPEPSVPPVVGDTFGVTSNKRLVRFDRATGALAWAGAISGLSGEGILGVDVRPKDGALYLLSSAGKLYTVDLTTGAATFKVALSADAADTSAPFGGLSGVDFGLDFNPVVDRLRVVSNGGQNLRINVDTGATTTDGALNPSSPGVSAAAYTNSFASACRTRLFVIDALTATLLLQDPPNDGKLSAVGALGTTMGVVKGFDIESRADGTSQALVATTFASEARIASVDLTTGVASTLSTVALAPGEWLNDVVALPPEQEPTQPRGELLAITEGKRLISFNRAAPGKLCSAQVISGMDQQEIIGADVRPADGALYVLARSGKLYTLAPDTAVATFKSALFADASDSTAPYAGLSGDGFGVGFNPVPDRLRVIGTDGQNLRINVTTGATTTDAPLNPGVPYVSALAYTNSFAGATSTTLYALDSWADSLVRVGGNPASGGACPDDLGNPNCGVVTSIGGLAAGGDVAHVNAFDIDGATGAALAALSLGTNTTSSLFSLDLSTGAALLPGATIGGGERVVALVW